MTDILTIAATHLTKEQPGGPVLSPFLPGTKIQYAWDSTSLGLLKTCPRLYQYTMIDGYTTKDESIHLRFGIEFHQALQDFDKRLASGLSRADALASVVGELLIRIADFDPDPDTKAGKYKNPRTLLGLVIDYIDHFNPDPAETHILENGEAAVELSFRFELGFGPKAGETYIADNGFTGIGPSQPYLLSGHLDRVVNFNDHLYVMDYKTTTTTPGDYYFNQYEPNNQMTLYTLAGKVVLNSPIKGVIINACQILLEQPHRFVRGFTQRTPGQLEEWLEDLHYHLRLSEHFATVGYWPQNDTACDKFGGCRFRKVCSKAPQVREAFLKSDFIQQPEELRWNPLRSR